MLFRPLFDPESSTYTYLLADEATREAVIIDPVLEQLDPHKADLAWAWERANARGPQGGGILSLFAASTSWA